MDDFIPPPASLLGVRGGVGEGRGGEWEKLKPPLGKGGWGLKEGRRLDEASKAQDSREEYRLKSGTISSPSTLFFAPPKFPDAGSRNFPFDSIEAFSLSRSVRSSKLLAQLRIFFSLPPLWVGGSFDKRSAKIQATLLKPNSSPRFPPAS